MDSKPKSVLCKEIVTTFIDSLAFLGLVSSEINQFRRYYFKTSFPGKMESLEKNVPAKLEWLFGEDLNKRINTISSTSTAPTASIRPHVISIRVAKQVAINNTMVQNTPKLPGGSAQGKWWPTKQSNRFHRN